MVGTDPPGSGLSRKSSLRDRPPLPQGPRTRSSTYSLETVSTPRYSKASTLYSPSSSSPRFTTPKSPGFSDVHILSAISEHPAKPPQEFSTSKYTQAPSTSPVVPKLIVKSTSKRPAFTPPQIRFDSAPLQWKGLSLEAALWTFSSEDLREMVSRAIRSSARRSFIRLLPLEDLDHSLPAEAELLAGLKAMTQSKYRFHVHRRTMLLQALNSLSETQLGKDKDALVGELTSQLSETTVECDRHLEELLQIADQQSQISKLQDVHWASALAVALRKLNKSYGRRMADLAEAKRRIEHLEAELEDAWKEAEKMAQEMDGLGADIISDDESEVEKAIFTKPVTKVKSQDGIILQVETKSPPSPKGKSYTDTSTAVKLVSDKTSIRTTRSARSARSTRSRMAGTRRSSAVEAAKRRSHRTSMGSLRLPSKRPSVNHGKSQHDQPPVPDLPDIFAFSPLFPQSYFLQFDSMRHSTVDGVELTSMPQMTIDDIQVVARSSPSRQAAARATVDDIGVTPRTIITDDIQVAARTPPIPADDINALGENGMFGDDHSLNGEPVIPSIWLNDDVPQTPAEHVKSLMQRNTNKKSPYHKLKTLTKRYSVPFLRFATRSQTSRPSSYQDGPCC